jgi:nucleoside phosphorylase
MKFLVVAAFEPELTEFRELARADKMTELAIEAIGVGLVEAAIGMTRCIARHAPTHALLLGTCGVLPPDPTTELARLAILDVVTARTTFLVERAFVESGHPPAMPDRAELDGDLHDALVTAGARSVHVANTLGITVDDGLALLVSMWTASCAIEAHEGRESPLAERPGVEHLEAFAFARACAAHGVAGTVALGVANVVGSHGREEWRQNHEAASSRAAKVAHEAIVRTSTRARSQERG